MKDKTMTTKMAEIYYKRSRVVISKIAQHRITTKGNLANNFRLIEGTFKVQNWVVFTLLNFFFYVLNHENLQRRNF